MGSVGKFSLRGWRAGIAAVILVVAMFVVFPQPHSRANVFLGGEEISVTIADTPSLQARGLGGHEKLEPNEGMLFVFPEPVLAGFWMKDMLFPIDIIYFDANRRIIDVWGNATPESYPKIFIPRAPAQFVLEVPAGFFAEHRLKMGNILEIPR